MFLSRKPNASGVFMRCMFNGDNTHNSNERTTSSLMYETARAHRCRRKQCVCAPVLLMVYPKSRAPKKPKSVSPLTCHLLCVRLSSHKLTKVYGLTKIIITILEIIHALCTDFVCRFHLAQTWLHSKCSWIVCRWLWNSRCVTKNEISLFDIVIAICIVLRANAKEENKNQSLCIKAFSSKFSDAKLNVFLVRFDNWNWCSEIWLPHSAFLVWCLNGNA